VTALVRSSQACCHLLMTKLELISAWHVTSYTVFKFGIDPQAMMLNLVIGAVAGYDEL
jgi:hypothetical protein